MVVRRFGRASPPFSFSSASQQPTPRNRNFQPPLSSVTRCSFLRRLVTAVPHSPCKSGAESVTGRRRADWADKWLQIPIPRQPPWVRLGLASPTVLHFAFPSHASQPCLSARMPYYVFTAACVEQKFGMHTRKLDSKPRITGGRVPSAKELGQRRRRTANGPVYHRVFLRR